MKRMFPLILAGMLVLMMATFSVGKDKETDAGAGKAAFKEYCGKCHDLDRSLKRQKTRDGWKKNVDRMSGYHKRFGGPIPEDARDAIVQYLEDTARK